LSFFLSFYRVSPFPSCICVYTRESRAEKRADEGGQPYPMPTRLIGVPSKGRGWNQTPSRPRSER
jgi:hypothetical protein